MAPASKNQQRLAASHFNDDAQFAPYGQWISFNSDRGGMRVERAHPTGAALKPAVARAHQLVSTSLA